LQCEERLQQARNKRIEANAACIVAQMALGILQAATSINESTVAFVPKLVIFGLVILLAGPVTLALFVDYIQELLGRIPSLIS
jgi:flagellar biosynthetic protein FliQ